MFQNDLRHEQGRLLWKDGSIYMGGWIKDKMTGKGLFYNHTGSRIEGKFVDGEVKGIATITFPADHKYKNYEG